MNLEALQDLQKRLGEDVDNSILEQEAYFFSLHDAGSSADFSTQILKDLRIKDFADAVPKNITLRHPVCLECFAEILKQLEFRVKSQEQEKDMYQAELLSIEAELATSGQKGEFELLEELQKLEAEEKRLDEQLDDLKKEESAHEKMISDLTKSKNDIKVQEGSLWQDVNSYERELSVQLEQNKTTDCQIRSIS